LSGVRSYFGGARFQVTSRAAEECLSTEGRKVDEHWGQLLSAAQLGDAAAYRLFLTSVTPFIRAVVRKNGRWPEDVDDIVQDSLLTVHRVRHTYEPGRPTKPWLAAIATRRSIDAMRRRGRIGAQEVHNEPAYETFADPQANNEDAVDTARVLGQMTSGLSPSQKEALKLVKLKELSLVEASSVSGQSVAALKVNIHRAMKKMRLNLSKEPRE
jgi:RNA polymerase sigma-70 factor (ECF subfamily)